MELAVEVLGRHHPQVQLVSLTNGPITLGRAFHSDVLLQDPRVDPRHLSVSIDEHGELVVQDLGSVNGSSINGKRLSSGIAHKLSSGDTLQLGKTRLRIYHRDHDVGPARSPSRQELFKDHLSSAPWLLGITTVSLLVYLLFDYLHFGGDYEANIAVRRTMQFGLQAGLWMLFWGTLNKLVRGEFNFWPHWCVGAVAAALLPVLDDALALIGFNWQSLPGVQLLDALINFALIGGSLYVALSFATHLKRRARLGAALVPAALLLITTYVLPMLGEQRMVAAPELLNLSRPPAFKVVGNSDSEQFVARSAALFEQANLTAAEQLEEERQESTAATTANASQAE